MVTGRERGRRRMGSEVDSWKDGGEVGKGKRGEWEKKAY